MKKVSLFIFVLILKFSPSHSVEKMDDSFLIHYGDSKAPLKVIEYVSFSCPHCVELYKEFPKIKKDFIDTGLIYFTFHLVPRDLTTIQALHCFEILNVKEKQVFLEGLFEYLEDNDNEQEISKVMQEFLVCLKKKAIQLDDQDYIKQSPIMKKAFLFISQEEQISAIPSAEINERLFLNELPNYEFFSEVVKAILGEEKK